MVLAFVFKIASKYKTPFSRILFIPYLEASTEKYMWKWVTLMCVRLEPSGSLVCVQTYDQMGHSNVWPPYTESSIFLLRHSSDKMDHFRPVQRCTGVIKF